MSKFILYILCVFISFSVSAETVYKKVNPDGSVEFTDTGSEDSEEIKIRKPTTYAPPRLPAINQLPVKKLKPAFNYDISINQPAENSVVTGGQTDVTVSVSVSPSLQAGHKFRYELVGQSIVSSSSSTTFKNVPRGTHSIIVTIIDEKGAVIGPLVSRNFHMKRFFKKPTAKPKAP